MSRKSLYRRVSRSKLARNILTLFSGKLTAQIILIGSTPIIARLFTPSDYGVAALILAIAAITSPLATLGYGTAAQMAPSEADARRLINVIIGSTLFFATALGIGLLVYSSNISDGVFSNFAGWEWAIPILFILRGAESALESWNTRKKNFKVQATTYVAGNALGAGSRIAFGATAGSSIGGLIIGQLIGIVTRVVVLARSTDLFRKANVIGAPAQSYRALVAQYRDFPLFNTPTSFLHTASKKLPLLFFGAVFSPAVAGFYAMADRLFFGPLLLLQTSFRSVFTQHLIEKKRRGLSIRTFVFKFCILTASIMVPPAVFLMLYAEPVITFLLGDKWLQAGSFISITAPLMVFASLVIPANAAMVVMRQQRRMLSLQIVTTLLLVLGLTASFFVWGTPEAALWTLVSIYGIRHCYTVFIALSLSGLQPAKDSEDSTSR